MRMLTDKKGLSDVVATVILCGVVLAIGISVWSWTYAITSGLQSDYYGEVKGMMDAVSKRFIIEHVAYVKSAGTLYVWVYNYGKVDIEIIQVVVRGDVEGMNDSFIPVASGGLVRVDVPLVATGGEELSITVMEDTRRQNFVYATYIVPYT